MKSTLISRQLLSRVLVPGFMLFSSFNGIAQHRASVIADMKLGKMEFADAMGYTMNEEYVQPGQVIRLKIPVDGDNHGQEIPAGSCKIKIGFGSKLELDPAFILTDAALDKYFKWTAAMNSGQVQVTGELVAPLPANFKEVNVAFQVKGTVIGKSTITANFLISNHNTKAILSDEDGANNMSFLHYTVTNRPAPVTVTTCNELVKNGCSLEVLFSADQEINLARFEVEASKDNVSFEKVATISAANNLSYKASFDLSQALQAKAIYVRIKTIERSGRIQYSVSKTINGFCGTSKLALSIYPNPTNGFAPVVINATEGILDGKYVVKMMDISGKAVLVKELTLKNAENFTLNVNNIASGKYLVQVSKNDGVQVAVLKFEKM